MRSAVPFAWRASRVRAGGTTLAVFETGSAAAGARAVLLLHGLGHWSDGAWGRLVPRLDPALRYVAIDLPGFGDSDKPDLTYDAEFFRRVVTDAVGALGIGRLALVGHSLGGFIAADFAGAYPERVERLVLVSPGGFARTPRHVAYALAIRAAGRLHVVRPPRGAIARIVERAVADRSSLDAEHVDRACALARDVTLRRAFASVYASALPALLHAKDQHRAFARYTGPVLFAWGRHDRFIGAGVLERVARVFPQVRTLVLERSGHLPMVEEPDALAAALRAFIAEP